MFRAKKVDRTTFNFDRVWKYMAHTTQRLLATESKKKETNFYDDNIGKNDCMCVQRPTEYYSL